MSAQGGGYFCGGDTMKESDKEYFARNLYNGGDCLSSHILLDYMRCPALYAQRLQGKGQQDDCAAFIFGRAVHCLVLEGFEVFKARYSSDSPINPKTGQAYGATTNAYSDWQEAMKASGIECITPAVARDVYAIAEAVNSHTEAMLAIATGEAEDVYRAKYCGVECQIKIDKYNGKIIDLKTCRDLDRFEYDFKDYRYANQMSFYQKVLEQVTGQSVNVEIVAAEKSAPYRVAHYKIKQSTLDAAQLQNEAAIRAMKFDSFTGKYFTGYEGTRFI
jgi:hypothetical protein